MTPRDGAHGRGDVGGDHVFGHVRAGFFARNVCCDRHVSRWSLIRCHQSHLHLGEPRRHLRIRHLYIYRRRPFRVCCRAPAWRHTTRPGDLPDGRREPVDHSLGFGQEAQRQERGADPRGDRQQTVAPRMDSFQIGQTVVMQAAQPPRRRDADLAAMRVSGEGHVEHGGEGVLGLGRAVHQKDGEVGSLR